MKLRWWFGRKLGPKLRTIYEGWTTPPPPNDRGMRDVEYSFIAANMPEGSGRALDYGCGRSWMPLLAARHGYTVRAVDVYDPKSPYKHPDLVFTYELSSLPNELITLCSVVEHIGLGRYGDPLEEDGDLRVMSELRNLLSSTGIMLLTIPTGKDKVVSGVHRVYGPIRLPRLLEGWRIIREEYWMKRDLIHWEEVASERMSLLEGNELYTGVGLYVLEKS